MRFSALFVAAAAPFLTLAAPVKMTRSQGNANIAVLQFAELLEQLETEFYTQALSKFVANDFTVAGISLPEIAIQNFQGILSHETAHVQVLDSALAAVGSRPIQGCQFNFDSVLVDVATMASVARLVEHVGVAAYMGGANLINDRGILAAAAQILTIEARHQSFLNTLAGANTVPQAFDVALTPQDVLGIAGAFISGGCDVAGELSRTIGANIIPNQPLALKNQGQIVAQTLLEFDSPVFSQVNVADLSCQMLVGGAASTISLPIQQCIVPDNLNGPVWIWITSNNQPLNANIAQRDASTIVAGPTAIFLDNQADALGALVRNVNGNGSGSVFQSSNVISPAEAASLLSSAAQPSATASVIGGNESSQQQQQQQQQQEQQNQNLNQNQNQNQNIGSTFQSNGSGIPPVLDLGITFIPASQS